METSDRYRVWPSDWRVVHFQLRDPAHAKVLLEPVLNRGELIVDGDCGRVWGEPKEEDCRNYHIQFYCHTSAVNDVVSCLRSEEYNPLSGRVGRSYWVCVTDPNDWGEKVNTIKWPRYVTNKCTTH